MKKCIRTAPYSYLIEGLDIYDGFDMIARGKHQPHIKPLNRAGLNTLYALRSRKPKVFTAMDIRSIETAHLISQNVIKTNLLNDITYEMSQILSKDDFMKLRENGQIDVARQRFMKAMVSDEITESFSDIVSRVESVLKLVQAEQNFVLVSHSFFMKVLEAWLAGYDLKKSPESFLDFYDGSSEAYEFLSGFDM